MHLIILASTLSCLIIPTLAIVQHIHLVEYNEPELAEVLQCEIFVTRAVFKCTHRPVSPLRHSTHFYEITQARREFEYKIKRNECIEMHEGKIVTLTGLNNFQLKKISNMGVSFRVHNNLLKGWINETSGTCGDAGPYQDEYDEYKNDVIVVATITASIYKEKFKIPLEDNGIFMNLSETNCLFSSGQCYNSEHGYYFWNTTTQDKSSCLENKKYSVVYNGPANVSTLNEQDTYTFNNLSKKYLLLNKGSFKICDMKVIKTDNPKLFIYIDDERISSEDGLDKFDDGMNYDYVFPNFNTIFRNDKIFKLFIGYFYYWIPIIGILGLAIFFVILLVLNCCPFKCCRKPIQLQYSTEKY